MSFTLSAEEDPVREQVKPLLERFRSDIEAVVPLVALWAHGSLALGDYQVGRSDLDLVALVGAAPTDAQQEELRSVHGRLVADVPLARTLHCTYVPKGRSPIRRGRIRPGLRASGSSVRSPL